MYNKGKKGSNNIGKFNYNQALRKATSIQQCQIIYNHELAVITRHYKEIDSTSYHELALASTINDWIKAENRAQILLGNQHAYGPLIKRVY